jgi:predicted helicase
MAPVTQATYVNARASAHQQQIFNVASSHVRAGGTNPVVTPSPETVSRQTTAAVDFYQSYLNTFSGRPIGGPQDEGH